MEPLEYLNSFNIHRATVFFASSPQTMVAVLESLLVRMEQYANNLEVFNHRLR